MQFGTRVGWLQPKAVDFFKVYVFGCFKDAGEHSVRCFCGLQAGAAKLKLPRGERGGFGFSFCFRTRPRFRVGTATLDNGSRVSDEKSPGRE